MARREEAPGARLLAMWHRLSRLPGGRRLFSWLVGRGAPYTGTVGAVFEEFAPGYARVSLRDRRKVRNHLASVHAVALANLGELVSGTAMMASLGGGVRGIVTRLEIEYLKKARGRLIAESRVEAPEIAGTTDHEVEAEIRDATGDVVARLVAHWRLSPREER